MISYKGIDEAELVHGLYHGQASCGTGSPALAIEVGHRLKGGVTVDSVRAELAKYPRNSEGGLYLDYFAGRALKLRLDPKSEEFDERSYDRDAGAGAAQRVVDELRKLS